MPNIAMEKMIPVSVQSATELYLHNLVLRAWRFDITSIIISKHHEIQPNLRQLGDWWEDQSNFGNFLLQLSANRFVSEQMYRGRCLVNIREYYDKDGEKKPETKGRRYM